MRKKSAKEESTLLNNIFEGILKIKGKRITSIHLGKLENAICDYFVICSGDSNTQVSSIAYSVIEVVRENTGVKPYHSEGYENAHWILIDYGSVVVHVFQNTYRDFYKLEDLWADGDITLVTKD